MLLQVEVKLGGLALLAALRSAYDVVFMLFA